VAKGRWLDEWLDDNPRNISPVFFVDGGTHSPGSIRQTLQAHLVAFGVSLPI
jgi:hypothetical protein